MLKCRALTKKAYIDDLEIDEVSSLTASADAGSKILERRASKVIYKETESPARYNCPIWTQGLERTFRVRQIPLIKGDFRRPPHANT